MISGLKMVIFESRKQAFLCLFICEKYCLISNFFLKIFSYFLKQIKRYSLTKKSSEFKKTIFWAIHPSPIILACLKFIQLFANNICLDFSSPLYILEKDM